jgi:hypothetical protein
MVIPHCPQLLHRDDRVSDLWKSVSTNGRAQVQDRAARNAQSFCEAKVGKAEAKEKRKAGRQVR